MKNPEMTSDLKKEGCDYRSDYYDENYSKIEEHFFWHLGRSLVIKKCLALLQKCLPRFDRAVEIGCGIGGNLQVLQSDFKSAVGYDEYSPSVDVCHKRGLQARTLEKDSPLPEKTESADLVCGFDVLEHIANDRMMLKECFRVLRPNGFLLLTVPAKMSLWSPFDDYARHFRRYEKKELNDKLGEAGFRPIFVSYFMFLLFPLFWARRTLYRLGWMRSDNVFSVPLLLNKLLCLVVRFESVFFKKIPFPVGASLMCLARKEER